MKNKEVVKDERGYKWFLHKNGKAEPTNWKLQAAFILYEVRKHEKKT